MENMLWAVSPWNSSTKSWAKQKQGRDQLWLYDMTWTTNANPTFPKSKGTTNKWYRLLINPNWIF